jgi:hypothetical protein
VGQKIGLLVVALILGVFLAWDMLHVGPKVDDRDGKVTGSLTVPAAVVEPGTPSAPIPPAAARSSH